MPKKKSTAPGTGGGDGDELLEALVQNQAHRLEQVISPSAPPCPVPRAPCAGSPARPLPVGLAPARQASPSCPLLCSPCDVG